MENADAKWLADKTNGVVESALARNHEKSVNLIIEIGRRLGGRGIYAMCGGMAAIIARRNGLVPDPRGGYTIALMSYSENELRKAMQFYLAYLNCNREQQLAVLTEAKTPEEAIDLPLGLVKILNRLGETAEAAQN